MIYSYYACGLLEWWCVPQDYPGRTLMVVPCWFRTYRPRRGLSDTYRELEAGADTMLALYAPTQLISTITWRTDVPNLLDASATLGGWLRREGRMVTFGAYTAELECDVVTSAEAGEASTSTVVGSALEPMYVEHATRRCRHKQRQ